MDKFHEKDSRIFQVIESSPESLGGNPSTSGLLAEALAEEMPEVEYALASKLREESKTLSVADKHLKAKVLYASQDLFNVFSFNLVQGDENQVLADKNGIVISEKLAKNLFESTENIVGKVVSFEHDKDYQVTGVFEDVPARSSMQFDFVLSFEEYKEANHLVLDWNFNTTQVNVLLKEGANADQFNDKIAHFLEGKRSEIDKETLSVFPFSSSYLYGYYRMDGGGRIEYVRLFSIIAIFILLIACINFMNLSTAKASRGLKEVGIKKAMGASRKTLIYRYLGESLFLAFLSLFTSILLILFFLPNFNEITGKQISLGFDVQLVLTVLLITVLTGAIAGSYPAFYLSGFNSISVLKGKLNASVGEVWARKGLVVFQFAISVILIVSVLVAYKQIEYIQSKSLGYNKDNVIHLEIEGKVAENLETFISEVKKVPGIISVSSMGQNIVGAGLNVWQIDQWEGKKPGDKVSFEMRPVSYGLIETLGIEMAEGRAFSEKFSTEDSKIILNEAAIREMGLKDPIGNTISIQGTTLAIIGVTKDFHFASLHQKVNPLFFVYRPSWTNKVMAKIDSDHQKETVEQLQQFYQAFNPGFPFHYQFLDENYQAQYAAEQRVATLSRYFAGIAIMISCLGLFGLAAFTAERRLKEIGIRKVLGSSEFQIIKLLSGDFTKMVIVAICIALPLSYFIAKNWLDNFAFKIDLEWWYFISAGIIALAIAWFTVGTQAIKAARINPVDTLKDE